MRSRFTEFLYLLFTLGVLAYPGTFAAGRLEEEPAEINGKGEEVSGRPLVKERVTIDYFMANHETRPFTANDLTIAELQRRTNVYFNIISIVSGYWDEYKVMLASKNLPDLIFTTVAEAKHNGMEGLFLPLDDLLERHGSNILKAMREEGIEEDMRALDGKIYFFPKISLQQPEPFMVRQDWLEKCNIKTPDTLEDIYQMLETFKEEDPAGNEKTIPYGSHMFNDPSICYLNAFYRGFTVDQDFMLKDDHMVWGPAQPEMKEAMKYLNRLYTEGLLDNEAPMPRFNTDFCMVISKDSPYAELIVRFFNYVFSPEGRMIVSYGVKGDSYEIVDGKPVFTEKMYSQEGGWNMFVKAAIGGRRIACWPHDDALMQQLKSTLALDALNQTWPYVDPPTPILNFDREELNVIEVKYGDLKDKTSEFLLKFLIRELSVDNSWDDYISELKRTGLDELEEAFNRAYARRYMWA